MWAQSVCTDVIIQFSTDLTRWMGLWKKEEVIWAGDPMSCLLFGQVNVGVE